MSDNGIGTLSESSLHAAVKQWYGRDGDRFEQDVDGYIIDIVRGERLIEIQTRHLYAMRAKLKKLLPHHPVTLVHPIAAAKWIVRQKTSGEQISRRKSPKRGRVIDIFMELVRLPRLLPHPNLTIHVLLTHQEEVWVDDGQGSWRRRGWSIGDRRLLSVAAQVSLHRPADFLTLLPAELDIPFTNKELAAALACRANVAQKMTYTLRHMGLLEKVGKRGRAALMAPVSLDE